MKELENELMQDQDAYAKDIKEKFERRIRVSNFLESKDQSKVSSYGGEVLSQNIVKSGDVEGG